MNLSEELPPFADRRPQPRKRALLGGIIVHSEGRHSFRCTIRNISETGARMVFPKGQTLPSDLILIDTRAHTGHRARIVWVTDSEAGLAFLSSFDMNALTDPSLGYLTRIWTQRS